MRLILQSFFFDQTECHCPANGCIVFLHRNLDLNAPFKVGVFPSDQQTELATLASDLPGHFNFSAAAEQNSPKLDRKQDLSVLCQINVFRAYMARNWNLSKH